jgi:hypothetical protein
MSGNKKMRGKRPMKRRFCGNKYTKKQKTDYECELEFEEETVDVSVLTREQECAIVSTSQQVGATPTRSQMKIQNLYQVITDSGSSSDSSTDDSDGDLEEQEVLEVEQDLQGYRLVDIELFGANLASKLVCGFCHSQVQLIEICRKGLSSEFAFHCQNQYCNGQESFPSCAQISAGNVKVSSVNRRAAFAMRCIGGDLAELETFCGIMDLPPPVRKSSYNQINKTLRDAACSVQADMMREAAEIEYSLAEDSGDRIRDIDISFDGTYMTRGFSSNVGVAVVIGCQTGKVLDTGTRSKVCKSCEYWKKQDPNSVKYQEWEAKHQDHCTLTHEGSSGGMESKIARDLFSESVEKYNLRYSRFIGDGDTNSFKKVFDDNPYGDAHPVEKIECVGHVQKRMGTRLRNLKKRFGTRPLADGKTIGGRGRLTNDQIDKIQAYYGNAIRANKGNLVRMREAVWAIYFHKRSSDDAPNHNLCCDSWCAYKKAASQNDSANYKHKKNLPVAVTDEIKPIFQDLSKTQLLEKCLDGYTQNANESLNNIIWKLCSKTKNHGLKTVETAVAVAVCLFSSGCKSLCDILRRLGIEPRCFLEQFSMNKDSLRIITAQRNSLQSTKEWRTRRRQRRLGLQEEQAEREGQPYLAGGH